MVPYLREVKYSNHDQNKVRIQKGRITGDIGGGALEKMERGRIT